MKKSALFLVPIAFVYMQHSSMAQSASSGSINSGSGTHVTATASVDSKIGGRVNVVTAPYGVASPRDKNAQSMGFLNARVFPNPVREIATLDVSTNCKAYSVQVYNMLGQDVTPGNVAGQLFRNTSTVPVSFANLPQGTYYIKLSSEGNGINKVIEVLKPE